MNVVVVAPTLAAAEGAVAEWRSLGVEGERLRVLAFTETTAREHPGWWSYPADMNLGSGLDNRPVVSALLRRALAGLTPLAPVWRRRWLTTLNWTVRSMDPDLVDLRPLPASARLARCLAIDPRVDTLVKGPARRASPPGSAWRRYDPGALISIVLPVYNGARWLRQAVDSCLQQTHRSLELIVVDDCSTDETPDIVADYARRDGRVRATRNAVNQRLPGALNVGFRLARGTLLTWTSHDNYFVANALETMARYLHTWEDVDFVYANYGTVHEDGRVDADVVHRRPVWYLRRGNPVGACFLYRREVYEAVGDFRPDLEYVEDYEYWVRVSKRAGMMRLPYRLYYYRLHPASMTAHGRHRYGDLAARVQAEHFGRAGG